MNIARRRGGHQLRESSLLVFLWISCQISLVLPQSFNNKGMCRGILLLEFVDDMKFGKCS